LALLFFVPSTLLPPSSFLHAQDTSVTRTPIRVCASGDITLGTNLDTAWAKLGARRLRAQWGLTDAPATLVAPLRPLFADADLLILNVETAIGNGPARTKCGPRSKNCYAFRAPPSAAEALRSLGREDAVVVGNVANNHARDAGNEHVATTIRHLAHARVLATGADTNATAIVLRDGVTVGVLGFYTGNYPTDALDLAAVRRHVARATSMYGTVIVTAHIGAEGIGAQRTRDSTELFLETIDRGNPVAFATAAFDGGAALVIGHGPHVLRAAEWRDDRLVIYSLGNLLTYGPFNNAEPLNRGAVACADLLGRSVVGADLRATIQRAPGVVAPDPAGRAYRLIDSLSVLDFPGTGARVNAWGELLRVGPTVLDTAASASSPSRGRGARASAGGSAPMGVGRRR
jgi:poly-gamma-glutamate capsule biosynthesis protein CapA/YwtB (metallophosphatase superfamily)